MWKLFVVREDTFFNPFLLYAFTFNIYPHIARCMYNRSYIPLITSSRWYMYVWFYFVCAKGKYSRKTYFASETNQTKTTQFLSVNTKTISSLGGGLIDLAVKILFPRFWYCDLFDWMSV